MCLSPLSIRYYDRVRGGYSTTTVPCGYCVDCLKDKQDEWSIRIMQEAANSGGFIFDTFTYNNKSVPVLDASGLDLEVLNNLSDESFNYLESHDWIVMYPEYSDIRNLIKRGRELYYKRFGKRLKFKYFICSEYGDKNTNNYRPHFHLCVFGISRTIWLEYFSIPWQKTFGFTYCKEFDFSDSKHLQNISRYVGKYCAKGGFDFCLVKDGVAPKPFRLVSNGLGVGYLDSFRKQMQVFNTYLEEFSKLPSSKNSFYTNLASNSRYGELLRAFRTNEVWRRLVLFDPSGYPHKLPRYYKTKLFGVEPSIWKTALSSYIQHRQERIYFVELQKFARERGFKDFKSAWISAKAGNLFPQFNKVCTDFDKFQVYNHSLKSKRVFDKLKVFFL